MGSAQAQGHIRVAAAPAPRHLLQGSPVPRV